MFAVEGFQAGPLVELRRKRCVEVTLWSSIRCSPSFKVELNPERLIWDLVWFIWVILIDLLRRPNRDPILGELSIRWRCPRVKLPSSVSIFSAAESYSLAFAKTRGLLWISVIFRFCWFSTTLLCEKNCMVGSSNSESRWPYNLLFFEPIWLLTIDTFSSLTLVLLRSIATESCLSISRPAASSFWLKFSSISKEGKPVSSRLLSNFLVDVSILSTSPRSLSFRGD